jgi:hypothetical protein
MFVPLIAELKRRRVFRALVGYAIVSFAVLQVIEPIMHGLRLPDWTLSFVVVGLAVGFPVVVVLAWVFDVSAGSIERTVPLRPEGSGGLRVALALGAVAALAVVPAVAWHFTRTARTPAAPAVPAAPSVAVLPFANFSQAKDEEYFSDGITEEVINALANVEGLRVVSRTSAFAYKNKNLSVRQIGEELDPASVIVNNMLGVVFFESRDYEKAIAAFRRTLELNPGFASAREMLACSYASAGRKAEALAELEQVKASAVEHVAMRAWILGVAGDTAGSRRLIRELQQRSDPPYGDHPAAVAALHGMLGDSDRAFALLEQAYAERDWMLRDVKVSPLWDSLRKDPRFPKLLQQMHLD